MIKIKNLAKLARIELSQKEQKKFQKELTLILDWVKILKKVDVSKTKPTFYPLSLKNVMREDEIKICPKEICQKIIDLMPEKEKKFLKVKRIFD